MANLFSVCPVPCLFSRKTQFYDPGIGSLYSKQKFLILNRNLRTQSYTEVIVQWHIWQVRPPLPPREVPKHGGIEGAVGLLTKAIANGIFSILQYKLLEDENIYTKVLGI